MKISLGSWAFSFGPYAQKPVSFEDTVARLAKAGYDGVEICGFAPHVTLETYSTSARQRELARFVEDHGLGISGYDADLSSVNPVFAGNETRYFDLFRRNLDLSVEIGSPSIRVDTGAAPGSIEEADYEGSFHSVAALWRDCANLAAAGNVRLVWEFEPGFVFNKPHEVVRMHQEVRHRNFFILFDTSHAYMCAVVGARQHGTRDILTRGVQEFFDMLQGRIGAIHLIDSDGTLHHDETSTHRPFGEGLIDFDDLAPKLLSVAGVEWWTIDMSFWPGSWELVESSREFVGKLLDRHTANLKAVR